MRRLAKQPEGAVGQPCEHPSAQACPPVRAGSLAHVEAIIGAGTTTAEEKAHFMAEMWTLLRATLGPKLREETYVVCHEIATNAYGRGGLTRAERDRRRVAG